MKIYLHINNYEEFINTHSRNILKSEKEAITRYISFGKISKFRSVNIGLGVDWLVLLLVVDIGLRIIKIGAEINDGIDGWIGIGKKLNRLFCRKKIVAIDKYGATALAISLIGKKQTINKLKKLQESTIDWSEMTYIGTSTNLLKYYIQTYCVNDSDVYVVGVSATGEAKIIKHFV